jgi:polysaccharide pyruvyl transferase WcaK-like protein
VYLLFSLFKIEIIYNKTLKKLRVLVRESDYIFVSPCGANIGIYRDWRFLIRSLIVIQLGGELNFHNNTIGKSGNLVFDKIAKYILRRSRVSVREKASQDYLKSINVFSVRSVDTAFLLHNEISDKINLVENYSVFIPTNLENWHPDFKDVDVFNLVKEKVLKEYVDFLKNNQLKLCILPHMHGEYIETELHNQYILAFVELGLPREQINVLRVDNFNDYNYYIMKSTFVVSMRYHGIVMAIRNKVPFISLGYENKMNEVCKYSNVEYLNYKLVDINTWSLEQKFDQYYAQREEIKETLNKSNTYLEQLAKVAIDQIEFNQYDKLNI